MQKNIVRITGPLKSRINRMAHAKAQQYALDEQTRLIAELSELAASGSAQDDLHKHLDAIEMRHNTKHGES